MARVRGTVQPNYDFTLLAMPALHAPETQTAATRG